MTPHAGATPARPLQFRLLDHIEAVEPARWDALVPAAATPFAEWRFLHALEASGSAAPRRGWTPCHPTIWRGRELVAAAPGYLKTHSMGEFLYNDFRWPEVAGRFGVRYYPKLILAVPFSPATGPRLLTVPGEDREALVARLLEETRRAVEHAGWSSLHVQFQTAEETALLARHGFAPGGGIQFQWENRGFRTFDDFLARFNAKRRHMLKSERAQLAKDGTSVRTISGAELTPEWLAFASACYEATVDKHAWNAPHLTPAFFQAAGATFPDRVELVVAEEGGEKLACAFNLRGPRRLYGRHWGALQDRRYLHFNVCYYHSIERAIAEGLEAFEPGAGGEHKLARGFEPTLVHGAHWFAAPRLHAAMSAHLAREVSYLAAEAGQAREQGLAFRAGTSGGGQE